MNGRIRAGTVSGMALLAASLSAETVMVRPASVPPPSAASSAQATPDDGSTVRISQIDSDLDKFQNRLVPIEGFVIQLMDPLKNVNRYILRDPYGSSIVVRTARPLPEVQSHLIVGGIVTIDPKTKDPYLYEESRDPAPAAMEPKSAPVEVVPPASAATASPAPAEPSRRFGIDSRKLPLILAIGAAFLGVLGLLIWVLTRGHRPPAPAQSPARSIPRAPSTSEKPTLLTVPVDLSMTADTDLLAVQGRTVKMFAPSAAATKTIKILPGKLEVIAGETESEAGIIRFFRPAGPEPQGGFQFTFGRAPGPPLIHIQLDSKTVSRNQASIRLFEGKHSVINRASPDSNPTFVNDHQMAESEERVLEDGDRIEMGEVVMIYHKR